MKTLTILGLVQTAILLFLLGKIVLFEEETTVAGPAEQNTLVSEDLTKTQSQSSSSDINIYPDEDRLRQIIREELAAQLAALPGTDSRNLATVAAGQIDEAEYQYRFESVTQKLDLYESVGSISDIDMQNLLSEIMTLNEAHRKQALSRLMRALNSGALKGRL